MRAPRFWWSERPGLRATLLAPLGMAYATATRRRVARPPQVRPDVPVICVGNLTVGGAGKTPTVAALQEELARRGRNAAVVSRGHGGSEAGPLLVDPGGMTAAEVGDEPLLLSAFGIVVVARDRAAGAHLALRSGADVLLLDDGFQNPAVAKDLSLVVIDAVSGFGNGRVLPAGPLREPVAAGLARAGGLVVIGAADERAAFLERHRKRAPLPCLEAELAPLATGMDWRGLRVVAFAGIGRPEKFFSTLRRLGADLVRTVPLGDHQRFGPALLTRLAREARAARAQLVTTEKDAVRLPAEFRREVLVLPVRLWWANPGAVTATLERLGL